MGGRHTRLGRGFAVCDLGGGNWWNLLEKSCAAGKFFKKDGNRKMKHSDDTDQHQ